MTNSSKTIINLTPREWLFLSTMPIIVIILCLYFQSAMPDDSFIYLRVAENIGTGNGWAYNIGQTANPCTSPLYTLILAAIGTLIGFSQNTLVTAYALGMITLAAVQYFAWRNEGYWLAIAMVIISIGAVRLLDCIGMETSVFLACIAATALSYRHNGATFLTGGLCGLTALSRPEGIAIFGILIVFSYLHNRCFSWRLILGAFIVLSPWVIFSTYMFHSPMPGSVAVKSNQVHMYWFKDQPRYIAAYLSQPKLYTELRASSWLYLTLSLVTLGGIVSWDRVKRTDPYLAICLSFGIVQVIGYHILDAPFGYRWYYAAGNFAMDMAVACALIWLSRRLSNYLSITKLTPQRLNLFPFLGSILLVFVLKSLSIASWHIPEQPYRLSDSYRSAAEWLQQHGTSENSVACTEFGYIGFFSKLEIVDIHGLIHPEALPDLQANNTHWWYAQKHPNFIVIHKKPYPWAGEPGSPTWPESLNSNFASNYHEVFENKDLKIFAVTTPTTITDT